jgi:hypothetical protein
MRIRGHGLLKFWPKNTEIDKCCMFQIADAFATVERLSEKDLHDLFGEQKRLSSTEYCITLRRRFYDPEYPQRFDAAFRRLTSDLGSARLH